MPESSEAAVGAESHPEILARFGGAYQDEALTAYVSEVGQRIGQASDLPDQEYRFTVLDSPVVNAFSLPGGYVYVTRGALAVADDEAELAAVLAHEIGHLAARHSAQRYSNQVLAEVTMGLGSFMSAGFAREPLSEAAGSVLARFSREEELEADSLAVRYLRRAGYDPRAVATMLTRLSTYNRIVDRVHGGPGDGEELDIMATHPSDDERLTHVRALGQAAVASSDDDASGAPAARDPAAYRARIAGMVMGSTDEQGLVRGRAFAHPSGGYVFTAPPGFVVENRLRYVAARGPEESALVFKPAFQTIDDPVHYITEDWGRAIDFASVERLTIDGLPAALGTVQLETAGGPRHVTLAAIRWNDTMVHRFIFIATPLRAAELAPEVRETIMGFHHMTPVEARRYREWHLGFHTVRPGETPARIAATMAAREHALDYFLALNALEPGAALKAGQVVKVVRE
jgi:predicted Zn-dependent protease